MNPKDEKLHQADLCYRAYCSILSCSVLSDFYVSHYFWPQLSDELWPEADAVVALLCRELQQARQSITALMEAIG